MKIINENAFRDFADTAKANGIEPHTLRPTLEDALHRQITVLLDRYIPYAESEADATKEATDESVVLGRECVCSHIRSLHTKGYNACQVAGCECISWLPKKQELCLHCDRTREEHNRGILYNPLCYSFLGA